MVLSASTFKHILGGGGFDATSVGQPQDKTIPITKASGKIKNRNLTNTCKTYKLKTVNMVDRN